MPCLLRRLLAATEDLDAAAALLGHEKLETKAIHNQPSEQCLARMTETLAHEDVTGR